MLSEVNVATELGLAVVDHDSPPHPRRALGESRGGDVDLESWGAQEVSLHWSHDVTHTHTHTHHLSLSLSLSFSPYLHPSIHPSIHPLPFLVFHFACLLSLSHTHLHIHTHTHTHTHTCTRTARAARPSGSPSRREFTTRTGAVANDEQPSGGQCETAPA